MLLAFLNALRAAFSLPNFSRASPLYEKLGDALYSIGFTAFQGKAGNVFMKKTWDIEPAKEGSLEELFHQTGKELMLIDFKGPGNDPQHWLNRPLKSRPLGHASMDAVWTRHLDAMIFTDTLTPSTPIKKESQSK
jgi:erythromycin esterase-like protein